MTEELKPCPFCGEKDAEIAKLKAENESIRQNHTSNEAVQILLDEIKRLEKLIEEKKQ